MNVRKVFERKFVLAALALCLAGIPVSAIGGDRPTCSDRRFLIDAPSHELALEICEYLTETAETMSKCGLKQTRPISVEVVPGISHPIGKCLAYFDCRFDLIKLTDPAAYSQFLTADNPYSLLPPTVLLRSLITHELAHALTVQTAGNRQVDIVDQEYIAAALELEFLDDAWREVLLRASPVSLPPKPGLIDIWIYGIEPRKFATNAWQHFSAQGNGCSLVMQIAVGQFSFAK